VENMEDISNFILDNVVENVDVLEYKVELYGADIYMDIDDMLEEIMMFLDTSKIEDIHQLRNNFGINKATLISFKYDGRRCEVGEMLDDEKNYFWVKMLPV
jgi:hypothetical protein